MALINPVPFRVTGDSEVTLKRYIRDRVISLREGLTQLHGNTGVVKWRKMYEAVPAEETREFPWHNASNLIVPVVGIHTDTLLARVLSATLKMKPFWAVAMLGDYLKTAPDGIRDALEEFLAYVALEPEELDLYRVEREWFAEIIKLGTGVVKTPWIKDVIDIMAPAGDGSGGSSWGEKVVYEGPRPEKLRYEDFKYPVYHSSLETMNFKYHVAHLQRDVLEERAFMGIYDKRAVTAMLASPDRTSPGYVQTQNEQSAKVSTIPGYGFAEWDVCECHFKYKVDASHITRVIVWYHEKTDQILRSYYHYYPGDIFVAGRLFYRDDMFPGMGFAETLGTFQEELSQIHNDRRNNSTIANSKVFRVDPDSKLNAGFRFYPSAMVPAKKDEIEALDMGTPVQGEIDSERLSMDLAERRSGVSPPMQGQGAGTNTKRGIYTAMGTLSVMQEGNTRTDLNITDIRYAHTKLGRLVSKLYATFGLGDRKEMFGERGQQIQAALDAMMAGRMALSITAATSSVNKEIEKQNDLMLIGVSERYNQSIMGMLQAATNPMTPEPIRKFLTDAILASNTLMQSVYRHFGFDEVDRLAPKPEVGGDLSGAGSGQPPVGQQPPGQPPAGGPTPAVPADLLQQLLVQGGPKPQ
jgi:hypothetical protein